MSTDAAADTEGLGCEPDPDPIQEAHWRMIEAVAIAGTGLDEHDDEFVETLIEDFQGFTLNPEEMERIVTLYREYVQ